MVMENKYIVEFIDKINGFIPNIKHEKMLTKIVDVEFFARHSKAKMLMYSIYTIEDLLCSLKRCNYKLPDLDRYTNDNIIMSLYSYISGVPYVECISEDTIFKLYNKEVEISSISKNKLVTRLETLDGLEKRSKKILFDNNILTVKDLTMFLCFYDIESDLRYANTKIKNNLFEVLGNYLDIEIDTTFDVKNNSVQAQKYFMSHKITIEDDESDNKSFFDKYRDIDRKNITNDMYGKKIEFIPGMSKRSMNVLRRNNVSTVKDLVEFLDNCDLKKEVHNAGDWTKKNIETALHDFLLHNHMVSIEDDIEKFLIERLNTDKGLVFLRRAYGESLREIGQNPNVGMNIVTRERVRQKEREFLITIKPFLLMLVNKIKGNRDYAYLSEFDDLYKDERYNKVIKYALLSLKDDCRYVNFANILL